VPKRKGEKEIRKSKEGPPPPKKKVSIEHLHNEHRNQRGGEGKECEGARKKDTREKTHKQKKNTHTHQPKNKKKTKTTQKPTKNKKNKKKGRGPFWRAYLKSRFRSRPDTPFTHREEGRIYLRGIGYRVISRRERNTRGEKGPY